MKKLGVLALAAGLLLGVSGCAMQGRDAQVNTKTTSVEMTLLLKDGREVLCIKVDDFYGISCDWPNAK